jgi:hypothetical protein
MPPWGHSSGKAGGGAAGARSDGGAAGAVRDRAAQDGALALGAARGARGPVSMAKRSQLSRFVPEMPVLPVRLAPLHGSGS